MENQDPSDIPPEQTLPQTQVVPKTNWLKYASLMLLILAVAALSIIVVIQIRTNQINKLKLIAKNQIITSPTKVNPTDSPSISASTSTSRVIAQNTKKLAVIFITYDKNASPIDKGFVERMIFQNQDSLSAFYKEVSYGRLLITGSVLGLYTLPVTDKPCDRTIMQEQARSAAQQDGVNLDDFDFVSYYFSGNTTCSNKEGWADIPGRESFIYTNNVDISTLAHELGHNLGLNHASSYDCTNENGVKVPISKKCTRDIYGDGYDIMGSQLRHTNSYHKLQLGWIDGSQVQTITKDGVYTLTPLETYSKEVMVIRILKSINSYEGKYNEYYYLEYRQPFGFDNFDPHRSVVNGILIHLAPDYTYSSNSFLLKMDQPDALDSNEALKNDQTFTDPTIGMSITPISLTKTKATISIKFSNSTSNN